VAALSAALAALLLVLPWPGRTVRAATASPASPLLGYASPVELLFSPDATRLYVLCQDSGEVRVLNATTYAPTATIDVGHVPRGFFLSPHGNRLFATNSWDDTLSVIDTRALKVVATWHVGMEPSSVIEGPAGKHLYIANRISNDVAVLDAHTGSEIKRLAAGRGASYMALSPDGRRIYVSHVYPNPTPYRTPPESELTVIDTATAEVVHRLPLPSIAGAFHIAFTPNGSLGVLAEMHPKNMVPVTQVEHGWAFEDTLELFGSAVPHQAVEVPLDDLDSYAVRPFGVAITPDGSRLYVSCGGSDIVTVINLWNLRRYLHTHSGPIAYDLAASAHYVVARISVGHDPRGEVVSADGRRLLVANRLDDTISVIDTATGKVVTTIPLPPSRHLWAERFGLQMFAEMTNPSPGMRRCPACHIDERHRNAQKMNLTPQQLLAALRRGQQAFYSANYSFHGGMGCANCHVDTTMDALLWNFEPAGLGRNIVENMLLEDIRNTAPYDWTGVNPNLPTQCGPRTELFIWRSQNYNARTLADTAAYLNSLPSRPNRWRLPNGQFSPAQERGRQIFDRTVDDFGKPIPLTNRCNFCHSGPLGTDSRKFDVGTKGPYDTTGLFVTAQLTNVALTAPYLHDGSAATLEEIWTTHNPHDQHGRTNDLTKNQLNDLIDYLRTR
jgi:YVTN family beta-propeller protein